MHLSWTDDAESPFVWWAESPDVDGFYAAADELLVLRQQVVDALAELGVEGPVVEVFSDGAAFWAAGGCEPTLVRAGWREFLRGAATINPWGR